MTRHVAVIDIGKTNAKLALVDADSLAEIAILTRPNNVQPGPPWPHFDVDGHWAFLLEGLGRFHREHGVDAISVTTHGACSALLDKDGALAAPILDYEHPGPDETSEEYSTIRPPFSETGSPSLTGGLNIGAQLFWQFKTDPGLHERTHRIVTYPQYWGHRLTGIAATDITSLGCHTDLWRPEEGRFSSLVETLDIGGKLAPVRAPADSLGPVLPKIADRTGLPPETVVYCGIHDSNASLLPYIARMSAPFSVVSTGTWVISMSIGGTAQDLDPALDTLINVTALGSPAPSARFMGGREHDLAMGGPSPKPTSADINHILSEDIFLMPAVVPTAGPFKGQTATWVGPEPDRGSGARGAAMAFYLAMVTTRCLGNTGHAGPILVEGPFATNDLYLQMLSVAVGADVYRASGTTGTSAGAAMLAGLATKSMTPPVASDLVQVKDRQRFQDYAGRWQEIAAPVS